MSTKLILCITGFLTLTACSTPYYSNEYWVEEPVVVHRPHVVHAPRVVVEEQVIVPAPKKRVHYVQASPAPAQPPMKIKHGSPQHPEPQMKVKHGKPHYIKNAEDEAKPPRHSNPEPGMKVQSGKPPHASQY